MAGSGSLAEEQSTDAVSSLKAILERHGLTSRTADSSNRGQRAAKESERGSTDLHTESHCGPCTHSMPTRAKSIQDKDENTTNLTDAIYESQSHTGHMRDRYFTSSPSFLSQSENVFTPNLSVEAVRELSLLYAGFTRVTTTTAQTYSELRDQECWTNNDHVAKEDPLTTRSPNLNQSLCVKCTTTTIPNDRRSNNQLKHVSQTCSECGDSLVDEMVDPTPLARNDTRCSELQTR